MSNNCKRHPNSAPVGRLKLRPRQSRHGKPLSEVYLSPGQRTVELNPKTKQYEVKWSGRYPLSHEQIAEKRNSVLRATASTNTYGKPNTGDIKKGGK